MLKSRSTEVSVNCLFIRIIDGSRLMFIINNWNECISVSSLFLLHTWKHRVIAFVESKNQ